MWVEKTKNGKFKFCEEYKDFMTGKRKKVSVTLEKNTTANRRLALGILEEKIQEKLYRKPFEDISLEKLVDKYRLYQKATIKASTYTRNYHACNSLMRILGKDVIANRLTAPYIKEKFLATGEPANTLNERRKRLKALLKWGYENDYVEDINFLDKIKPFDNITKGEKAKKAESISDKFLEQEELKILLEEIRKTGCEHWLLLTEHLATSGLRIGELIALDKKDVDLDNKVNHITKTYDYIHCVTTSPKTPSSVRDNFIQPELETVIKKINLYTKKQQILCGYGKTDIFFPNMKGGRIRYCAYNKFLREVSERCLTKTVTPHVLRHTHASLLAEQGAQLETIMRRLGHANSNVTKKIYVHVTKKIKQNDNLTIANIQII